MRPGDVILVLFWTTLVFIFKDFTKITSACQANGIDYL